ncbi:NTP transferase domain-containing protein [Candidatus Peregrinibacteria bacterium]|nr:NTP transferase domain-containing protein [Candidatus Peregrinibacteria bacterium]
MHIQVLLLCSGQSKRMWPLSDKIFFDYLGKTVLEHQIEKLLSFPEFDEIHIVGNEENIEKIQALVLPKFAGKKIEWTFSIQKKLEEGMLGGVLDAQDKIDMKKPFLLMSSNDFVENFFFANLLQKAAKSDSDILVCGKNVEKYFPGGYLVYNSQGFVEKILEKPGMGNEPSHMINLVFHFFRNPKNIFHFLQKERKLNSGHYGYENGLQKLFDSGQKCEVVEYDGFWQALKYPWDHLRLMEFFLLRLSGQDIHPSAQISPHASILGDVVLEEGVKVFDFAVINGPAYIGKNCIIGNHVLVRNSHIGADSLIGHGTEVARSYFLRRVRTHQNYVGDSVLDENISFGAGTRTGNLRLDEGNISVKIFEEKIPTHSQKIGLFCGENVRVGINTSIMPGVKIGKNSFIGASLCLEEDIPDRSFKKGVFQSVEKENRY